MRSLTVKFCFVSFFVFFTILSGCKKEEPISPTDTQNQKISWNNITQNNEYARDLEICGNGYIFAITPVNVLRSKDEGKTWEAVCNLNYGWSQMTLGQNDEIYVVSGDYSLKYSDDYGNSWRTILAEQTSDGKLLEGIYCFTVDKKDGKIFLGTNSGIAISDDKGRTWNMSNNGLGIIKDTRSLYICSTGEIIAAVNYKDNPSYISKDHGGSWAGNNLRGTRLLSYTEDSTGTLFAGDYNGFYFSVDKGMNWNKLSSSNSPFCEIKIDKNLILYASMGTNGFAVSKDRGKTWEQNNPEVDNIYASSLAIDKKGFIYFGTHGNGIYKSKKSVY